VILSEFKVCLIEILRQKQSKEMSAFELLRIKSNINNKEVDKCLSASKTNHSFSIDSLLSNKTTDTLLNTSSAQNSLNMVSLPSALTALWQQRALLRFPFSMPSTDVSYHQLNETFGM
jgi:hypothetical protein